jgi:hypothetical protein
MVLGLLYGGMRAIVSTAILLAAVATIVWARSSLSPEVIDPRVGGLSADALTKQAADQLEAAVASDGVAFHIVQTSTMRTKPGGPLIDIPDPSNGRVIIGQAEEYLAYVLLERGVIRPNGFWSEIRAWPASAGEPVWDKAELRRSAVVRDGVAWRNDREGWYRTEVVPGIGLDPATAALLPKLLRESTGDTRQADTVVDGAPQMRVDATAEKANIPGVVAADGAPYTQLLAPVEFAFDATGRLVSIRVVALNTNLEEYDLVVDTLITLRYDGVGGLPQPDPTWVPKPPDPAEVGQ